MPFLRQSYKQKPKQWGPFSAVQSGLFHNAEKIGIDPTDIALAMPFWNPGNQIDYSKNGLVGANNGAIFEKNSLYFDGSDNLALSKTPEELDGGVSFSVYFTINLPDTAGTEFRVIQQRNGGFNGQYIISISTTGTVGFDIYNGGYQFQLTSNLPIDDDKDHHVCCVREGTFGGIYIDGVLDNSTTGAIKDLDNSLSTFIGYDGRSVSAYLVGTLHQLSISADGFASDQIALLSENTYQLWQPRTPVFYSFATGGLTLSLSDTINATDSISKKIGLNKSDSISLSDSMSKLIGLNKSDIINLSDNFSAFITLILELSDSISMSDEISKKMALSFSETINMTDNFDSFLALLLSLSDSISMSDSMLKGIGLNKSDTITMSDDIIKSFGLTRSDIITMSDNFSTDQDVIYALLDFIAKNTNFNFNAKNKTFNFNAKSRGES